MEEKYSSDCPDPAVRAPVSYARQLRLLPKIVLDLGYALTGRSGLMFAGFAVTTLITRLLSPAEVGSYFLMVSVVIALAPIANLGQAEPMISAVGGCLGKGDLRCASTTARSILNLGYLGAAAIATAILVLWPFLRGCGLVPRVDPSFVVLLALWVVVAAIQPLLIALFQGAEDIRSVAVFDGVAGKVLSLAGICLLLEVARTATLNQVLVIVVGGECISLVAASYVARRTLRMLGAAGTKIRSRDLWRTTWPYLLHHLTATIAIQSDILVLGLFRPAQDVALYGAALRLSLLASLPAVVMNVPLAPRIARYRGQDRRAELQGLLQMAATAGTLLAVALATVYALAGKWTLAATFGAFYAGGSPLLLILTVGQCLSLLFGPCFLVLAMSEEQPVATRIAVATSIGRVVLSLTLAWPFGAMGVAIASLVGSTVAKALAWCVADRRLGLSTRAGFTGLCGLWSHMRRGAHPQSVGA